jgi:hypothetical protein
MRLQIRRLVLCSAILFTPVAVRAQETKASLSQRTSEAGPFTSSHSLPDAPRPLLVSSSVEEFYEEAVEGQSQSGAGASEVGQDGSKPTTTQDPTKANIGGSVLDTNGDVVPRATVVLEGPGDRRSVTADESGAFQFSGLKPGIPYQITIGMVDFETWKSQKIILTPGQFYFLVDVKLKISESVTSVTVYASNEQIATEQVRLEEKQRIFGIIPNFYVTYDQHPVPLTTKLKYRLAFKADTDPVTFFGVFFMATMYQAGDIPSYGQGWDAYFQRVGAGYADTTTDIFIGGAILPSLLHQDPRYFYQGTGTKKSRLMHAMSSPYVCKGDNGKTQPNYSSLGGDLASGAISNLYYPDADKGAGLVFQGFAITTGVRTVNAILQEFVIRKLTPSARNRN